MHSTIDIIFTFIIQFKMVGWLTCLINGCLDRSSLTITFLEFYSTIFVSTFMIVITWLSILLNISTFLINITTTRFTLNGLTTFITILEISSLTTYTIECTSFIIITTRLFIFWIDQTLIGSDEFRTRRSIFIHRLL